MRRILIVEDNLVNFFVLQEMLNEYELELVRAEDGQQFYGIIKESHDFDVILMDLMLPDTDGIELTKHLIDNHIKIPVVFISAYTERCEEIFDLGVEYFISKPVYKELFLSILKKFVALSKNENYA
jgi:CheY-like chemotaxis protein